MSDATTPAVVPDAQRYGHDEAIEDLERLAGDAGLVGRRSTPFCLDQLVAYIESLEAERDALRDKLESGHWLSDDEWYAGERANADFLRQYNAMLVEHEAVGEGYGDETADAGCDCLSCRIIRAHDNAERVIHGE